MASELITDDFNRSEQELHGSVSAEGWAWERVNSGASFLRIGSEAGLGSSPGVRPGSGFGDRYYRAGERIAGETMGVVVDVCEGADGAALLLRVTNGDNFVWAFIEHESGIVRIGFELDGAGTIVSQDTLNPIPAPPYEMAFYMVGGVTHVLVDGVEVLSGGISDPEVALLDNYCGIGLFASFFDSPQYDNFNAGLPWLLGIGVSDPQGSLDSSNPLVRRRTLDEQRRSSLLGGRQNTILTSPLGLTDTVPVARVHLLGRC